MSFIAWIIIGGILGWLASIVMGRNAQMGVFLNIVVGIVGAFLGGLLLSPLFGTARSTSTTSASARFSSRSWER